MLLAPACGAFPDPVYATVARSRQELGAAGECSGIRRIGGCCGTPYSL